MLTPDVPTITDNTPVFDLCSAREKRFLNDLMREEDSRLLHDHPLPELYALLRTLENMWGGEYKKSPAVPQELMYYLVVYATYAHHIPEDVESWRRGATDDVYHILQGFMESVTFAITDGTCITHKDDGVYLDLFRIPQWFYDEVMKGTQP